MVVYRDEPEASRHPRSPETDSSGFRLRIMFFGVPFDFEKRVRPKKIVSSYRNHPNAHRPALILPATMVGPKIRAIAPAGTWPNSIRQKTLLVRFLS